MIVYLITNKINGKQYIGQTIQPLEDRWRYHKSKSSRCLALKSAIDKYGVDSFEIEILTICNNDQELNKKEVEFIKQFNTLAPNGYNLTTGGERPYYSNESREKMSKSGKNRSPISEDTSKKLSNRIKGEKNHNFGKKFNEEHREKLSNSHIGKISTKRQKVICYESNKTYQSISEAAKDLNMNVGYLHQIINGKRKSPKGLTFGKVL